MRKRQRSAVHVCAYHLAGLALGVLPAVAHAAQTATVVGGLRGSRELIIGTFLFGVTLFAAVVALYHLASRRRAQQREAALVAALNAVHARLDRAETFLSVEHQLVIVWGSRSSAPEIGGALDLAGFDSTSPADVLAFASWLPPDQANALETCVARLRDSGEAFRIAVATSDGRHLEAQGLAVTGYAVVRLRDVSGDRLEAIRLREDQAHLVGERDAFRALLDAVACPTWMRDAGGRLTWVNVAYTRAVEARDRNEALLRSTELLEQPSRDAATHCRAQLQTYRDRAAAVVAGYRRSLEIVEVPQDDCSVGMAFDVSELEAARVDLQQTMKAHARTLDQLSTAVAIFDRRKQLVFHNTAYRQLWSLDQAFLDQGPSESEILDRLRTRRMLPEQADFRGWKEAHLAAYQSPDTSEEVWYLPDGRTLRAVINPNPQSGVTYLFDDVSAHFHLESQFNAQTRVQRETLDTLKEGVAVFGTDGRLKLANAAFAALWRLQPSDLDAKPHIDRVRRSAPGWRPTRNPGARSAPQ